MTATESLTGVDSDRSLSVEQSREPCAPSDPMLRRRDRIFSTTFSEVIEVKMEYQINSDSVPSSPAVRAERPGKTTNACTDTGELSENCLDACEKAGDADDSESTSPISPLLNRWFASVEKRRCRRAATACVGAKQDLDCELPTPTGSRLWNRRLLRQSNTDQTDGVAEINKLSTHGREVAPASSFVSADSPEVSTTSPNWRDKVSLFLPCCCSRSGFVT